MDTSWVAEHAQHSPLRTHCPTGTFGGHASRGMLRDVHPIPEEHRGRGGGTAASQRARFQAGFLA